MIKDTEFIVVNLDKLAYAGNLEVLKVCFTRVTFPAGEIHTKSTGSDSGRRYVCLTLREGVKLKVAIN